MLRDLRPVGDAAVLAVLGDGIDHAVVQEVWSAADALGASLPQGVLDIVPAYASVLIRFDPSRVDLPRILAATRGILERIKPVPARPKRHLTVGVCFGGEHGVDFERCAHELGMREARLRSALCKPEYSVAFLGFIAGFPYLLGLHPALQLPRLATPRPRVPAGSVAIAGAQCGIYPRQSPGGWRLMGRTQAQLFDPRRSEAALFRAGDLVRLEACGRFEATASVEIKNDE